MRGVVQAVLIGFLLISCSKIEIDIDSHIPENNIAFQEASSVENVLKRAQQLSRISWTPIFDVPNNLGVYRAGVEVLGIPYSSVKELDKYVGLDVSFKTFMTAVHNPRSVLYTENVGKDPYFGTNCSTYYGTVCSSAVDYAFGLRANYSTSMIDSLSFFHRDSIQSPERIQICDVLWSKGHEVMVYDIIKNPIDSCITYVSILESAGIGTSIHGYSFDDFKERWKKSGWVIYRYNFERQVPYSPSTFIPVQGESYLEYAYNDVICPSRGDCAVYREGEDVIINILNASYSRLNLYRNNLFVEERNVSAIDEVFHGLPFGSYSIVATNIMGDKSDEIHFEIVDTNVKVEIVEKMIAVSFNSKQGNPIYLSICDKTGSRYLIREFTEQDIENREVRVSIPKGDKRYYCKVFFETDNGTVTNAPILVNK